MIQSVTRRLPGSKMTAPQGSSQGHSQPIAAVPTWQRILNKLLKWILVGVAIGILPIIVKTIVLYTSANGLSERAVLGSGEFYLVAAGLTAGGIGELFFDLKDPATATPMSTVLQIVRSTAVALAVIIIILGAAVYGNPGDGTNATDNYMNVSIVVLIAAVLSSGSCVVISELK